MKNPEPSSKQPRRFRMNLLFVLLLLNGLASLSLIPPLHRAYQNYNGVCLKEGRVLTDEEKIARAVEKINKEVSLNVYDNQSGHHYFEVIPYSSPAEFMKRNPDCCALNPKMPLEVGSPDFLDKIFGVSSDALYIIYQANYLDEAGVATTSRVEKAVELTNCGFPQFDNTHGKIISVQ